MTTPGWQGPQYPLSREEFRRALTTGHGRARIHVQRFGAAEFRAEILEAASVCKILNIQDQGLRTEWLAELCVAAGVVDQVVAQPVPDDDQDRQQRAGLLLDLAVRGIAGAREALYACWGRRHYSRFYATDEILELDGAEGVLFVARAIGSEIRNDSAISAGTDELWKYDESRSEGAAQALLASLTDSDDDIRAYLDSLQREQQREGRVARRPEESRKSTEQVLHAIRTTTQEHVIGWVGYWGRRASREEIQHIFDAFLAMSEPHELEGALRCLGGTGLPPLHPRIFELTRHESEKVRYWAARVLSKHSLSGVRTCGLDALARGDLLVALEILTRSAQVDDVETLVAALLPIEDPDEEHGVCYGILDLFRHSPEVRASRLALHVYERTPCMHCREDAVEWLQWLQACPPWVLDECAFDGSESIRKLAAEMRSDSPARTS